MHRVLRQAPFFSDRANFLVDNPAHAPLGLPTLQELSHSLMLSLRWNVRDRSLGGQVFP